MPLPNYINDKLRNKPEVFICDKDLWLIEFLKRTKASLILKAEQEHNKIHIKEFINNLKDEDLFNFLIDPLIFAYLNQDYIKNWEDYLRFEDVIEYDNGSQFIEGHPICIYTTPHKIFQRILNNFKLGSLGPDASKAGILSQNHEAYNIHSKRIKKAFDLISDYCPSFYEMVCTYMPALILVDKLANFRGSTSYSARGLSYFRPLPEWDHLTWAEEIVHEATHNQINAILSFDPIIMSENAFELRVRGPIRKDVRHHHGNFHALLVISRITQLNEILAQQGHEAERLRKRNKGLVENSYLPFSIMQKEVVFSKIGRFLFNKEIVPLFR